MDAGFIGLGTMGGRIARRILAAGHAMNDARREAARPLLEAGAKWAETPAETASRAEVVFTSLPGPAEKRLRSDPEE
jgi:3-hydroxyisobutyrate dehydrogenase-like beta-hydroxyacid dehydrogenase